MRGYGQADDEGTELPWRPVDKNGSERARVVAHAAARGSIAAMAMSGARTVTKNLGLLSESPPEAVLQRGAHRYAGGRMSPRAWEVMVEAAHWSYGAFGGAVFGSLPDTVRRREWAGPLYGVVLWLAFEAAIAPLLRLRRETKVERLAVLADHLIYGLVLSEIRRRPQH
ncbi:MAG: hypothetical protein ACODAF_05170 [Actinomycetota bacterium]